jgi:hypothetical protein
MDMAGVRDELLEGTRVGSTQGYQGEECFSGLEAEWRSHCRGCLQVDTTESLEGHVEMLAAVWSEWNWIMN